MKKNLLLFVCSAGLYFSCQHKKEQIHLEKEPVSLVAESLPDTLSPPEVFPISGANAPQPIRINPKMIPLKYPYGVGKPTIIRYGVAEGLPSSAIQDLVKDKYGNIWIGGLGNLSKFDGTSFTNYSSAAGIGSGFITRLLFDSRDDLWIATFEGLYKFNGQAFVRVSLGNNGAEFSIPGLIEDNAGDIWASTNNGVYRIHRDSISHFTTEHGLSDNNSFSILKSNAGQILVSTVKGIVVFDGEKFIPYTGIKYMGTQGPTLLLSDSKGNLWFFNWVNNKAVLGMFDGQNTKIFGTKEGYSGQSYISCVFEDGFGNMWISTIDKLFRYKDGDFVEYTNEIKDGWSGGKAFIKDDAGDLWSGGINGLFRISMNYLNMLEIPGESKEVSSIHDLAIDANGSKWVMGNNTNTLIKYDRNEAAVYDLRSFLGGKNLSKIYADKKGNIWSLVYGTGPVFIRFDGTHFFRYSHPQLNKRGFAYDINEDKEGNIIVSGYNGLASFDGKTIAYYGPSQGFPDNTTTSFTIADQGNGLVPILPVHL